jgi:transposase-like protein
LKKKNKMLPILRDFLSIIGTEEKCVEYLCSKKVFYEKIKCDICSKMMNSTGSRQVFRCSRCRKEKSLRFGTFFYGSKLGCSEIMLMGYFWLSNATHLQICTYIGLSRITVTRFFGHFRQLVSSTLEEEDTLIGGDGVIVEIDETKISKRKYNRGHRVEGAWIVGGVEKTAERRVFLVSVENRLSETLEGIIRRHVATGSIIHTDLWRGYSFLNNNDNYGHQTVNHSEHLKDPETGVHTNTIEGTWSGLKRNIQVRNRTREGIENHLFEFIWRRKYIQNLWEGFLTAIREIHYDLI